MQQKEKLNELISAIHEKDDLLDSQEDFLIKENKKHVKIKNAYALEIEKCEKLSSDSDRGDDKKGRRKEKKRYYKKKGGDAHVCREWDSDESSTESSSDEDAANIVVTKGLLFPNVGHKCLMAKDDKKEGKI